MMNMKYFFDLINEKRKIYNSINDNMKKYALNLTINTNIEKRFDEIDKIMNSFSNEGNPFSLEEDLKYEYQKLIKMDNSSRIDKKKLYLRKKTLSMKSVNLLHIFHLKKDSLLLNLFLVFYFQFWDNYYQKYFF